LRGLVIITASFSKEEPFVLKAQWLFGNRKKVSTFGKGETFTEKLPSYSQFA
jgi:hypothetical protein